MPNEKKKTKGHPSTPKTPPATPFVVEKEAAVSASPLTAQDRAMLERINRFLINIPAKALASIAARNGYTADEHARGWDLYNKANGGGKSLAHLLGEQEHAARSAVIAGDRLRLLTEIDAFENRWFPRIRTLIPVCVPRASRQAFADAFFKDLVQQPLSPAVVGSVGELLKRVKGLAHSDEPGAKELLSTLHARGLTSEAIAQMEGLLKQATDGAPPEKPKSHVTAEEIAKAQEEQLEALDDVKAWYNAWATHLRPVFNRRQQIVLGLTSARTANADDESTAEDDAAPEDGGDASAGGDGSAAPEGVVAKPAKGSSRKAKGK